MAWTTEFAWTFQIRGKASVPVDNPLEALVLLRSWVGRLVSLSQNLTSRVNKTLGKLKPCWRALLFSGAKSFFLPLLTITHSLMLLGFGDVCLGLYWKSLWNGDQRPFLLALTHFGIPLRWVWSVPWDWLLRKKARQKGGMSGPWLSCYNRIFVPLTLIHWKFTQKVMKMMVLECESLRGDRVR